MPFAASKENRVGLSVKPFLAMTGEITLRGKVLAVGGIKEKILAAKRAGIKEVILCKENKKHVEEIEPEYIQGLKFYYVDRMEEVLELAIGVKKEEKKKENDVPEGKKRKTVGVVRTQIPAA